MTRTRSEYRLRSLDGLTARPEVDARPPTDHDRDRLAHLLLDAYRNTIDDEGEELADAIEAIDHYLGVIDRSHSLVVERDGSRLDDGHDTQFDGQHDTAGGGVGDVSEVGEVGEIADSAGLAAACFVLDVDGITYIDPVIVATSHQRRGLGGALVLATVHSLAEDDVAEVGATITDGNVPSERLFTRLGFERVGAWG